MATKPPKETTESDRSHGQGFVVTPIKNDKDEKGFVIRAEVKDAKEFRAWVRENGAVGIPYAFVRQSDRTLTKAKVEKTTIAES
jgi:hypothetical protein